MFSEAGFVYGGQYVPNQETGGMKIGSTLYTSNNTNLCIHGDVYLSESGLLNNNGHIFFKNNKISNIFLPDGTLGSGTFSFQGDFDTYIRVENGQSQLSHVQINTDASVNLTGFLSVVDHLMLESGLLKVDRSGSISVLNADADAIIYNNSPFNASYVTGPLGRNVRPGQNYFYPVGDDRGYYPFFMTDISTTGSFVVAFDRDIPFAHEWQVNNESTSLQAGIGWEVTADIFTAAAFSPGLSIYNDGTLLDGHLGIFYKPGTELKPHLDWQITTSGNYITGSYLKSAGIYALAKRSALVLPNFFVPGHTTTTRFEIPNVEKYSSVELVVTDRLGLQVFKSNRYINELDVYDFPGGTYFYQLTLYEGRNKQVIYNFFEVKHER